MDRPHWTILSTTPQILSVYIILFVSTLFMLMPSTALAQQSGITSPATGASVNGALPIFGTAVIEPFQKYELHYKMEPSGDQDYSYFDGDTKQVTSGQLGVLQSDGFAPGTYSIRLRVVKQDGNYAEYFAQSISINQVPEEPPTAIPTLPPPPPPPTAVPPPPTAVPTLPPPPPTAVLPTATFVPAPTATRVTIGSFGIDGNNVDGNSVDGNSANGNSVDENGEGLSQDATETPIPTQTFTPAPQPTLAVGEVTQPEVETNILPTRTPLPTNTPIQVAAVIDAPQGSTNSASDTEPGSAAETVTNSTDNVADTGSSTTGASTGSDASEVASVAEGNQSTSGFGSSSITRQLGNALALNRMRAYFLTGMRYSASIIFVITLLFVSKGLLRWIRSQL